MHLIKNQRLIRLHPEQLMYTVRLETDDGGHCHVWAGPPGQENDRTPWGLAREEADAAFERFVQARHREGFRSVEDSAVLDHEPPCENESDKNNSARKIVQPILLKRLHPDAWRIMPAKKRSRLVWRIGELRIQEAVPQLLTLIGTADTMLDYCLCWTLGRCSNPRAIDALDTLRANSKHDVVKRMATLAWLNLVENPLRQKHADKLIADWPAVLREAWATQDQESLLPVLSQTDTWERISQNEWLEQLDQVAQASVYSVFAKNILVHQLRQLRLHFGTFRAARRLYKAAESRSDARFLGILHELFEMNECTTRRGAGDWVRVDGQYVKFSEAIKRQDSGIAYTDRTRAYFRRRTWRTLRRLGELETPAFVKLAAGILQALDDSKAESERVVTHSYWDSETRKWVEGKRYLTPYSGWVLYYQLLHSHHEHTVLGSNRQFWWSTHPVDDAASNFLENPRGEVYPHLWDKQPQILFWLLQNSRCAGVHEFAARALCSNTEFCSALTAPQIFSLMQSGYTADIQFAFHNIRHRLTQAKDAEQTFEWLLLLVGTPLEAARQFALTYISENPSRYFSSPQLIAAMFCSPEEGLRKLARLLCEASRGRFSLLGKIIEHLLEWLENSESWSGPLPEITDDLRWVLRGEGLGKEAEKAPYERLLALLNHPSTDIASLSADWLLIHRNPLVSHLPAETLQSLMQADDPERCGIGVRLFGALPDNILFDQAELFARCCVHPQPQVRRALFPALERLMQQMSIKRDRFVEALLPVLLDALFRSETGDGVHADALAMLQGPLANRVKKLDADTHLRLMLSQSKAAQSLGSWLLSERKPRDYGVRNWAALARVPELAIRQWACQCYQNNIPQVLSHMEDALRIFDSRWEDVQEFALTFFRSHGQWTPALLISLCDHSRPSVQEAGRELIKQHARLEEITDYLLKLSQHPSASIQLLVSDWLEQGIGGDIDRLTRLRPYFLSVLSQVNRARQVKNRVLAFLHKKASESEQAAAFVAELFARQVVSVSIMDKAKYLEGLQDIQQRYPQLDSPLKTLPPRQGGGS